MLPNCIWVVNIMFFYPKAVVSTMFYHEMAPQGSRFGVLRISGFVEDAAVGVPGLLRRTGPQGPTPAAPRRQKTNMRSIVLLRVSWAQFRANLGEAPGAPQSFWYINGSLCSIPAPDIAQSAVVGPRNPKLCRNHTSDTVELSPYVICAESEVVDGITLLCSPNDVGLLHRYTSVYLDRRKHSGAPRGCKPNERMDAFMK